MPPRRNNYYDATIRRMVKESLERKEEAFRQEHGMDPDGMLLEYLRQSAAVLGHSPHERELLGGAMIAERFGSWENALKLSGLPGTNTPDKSSQFQLLIEEEKIQKQIYAQRKAEKKQLVRAREADRAKKKKENNGSAD